MTIPPLYAHRLGRDYGPDSSATALAGALAAGADGLETDAVYTNSPGELRNAAQAAATTTAAPRAVAIA